jgi:hypothetical protein
MTGEQTGERPKNSLQISDLRAVSKIARGHRSLGGSNPSPSAQPSGAPGKGAPLLGSAVVAMTCALVHKSPLASVEFH